MIFSLMVLLTSTSFVTFCLAGVKQSLWKMQCTSGVLEDPNCPVDGGWSTWSEWSPCAGSCDDIGKRVRSRDCNNPPPSNGGAQCIGNKENSETCYLTHCTVDDFKKIVASDEVRKIAMQQLELVPNVLERCVPYECSYETVENSLSSDNTWQISPEILWNAIQCVKRNLGCQVKGAWEEWGPWSACSALCGSGFRWRLRRCNSPSPSDARSWCEGEPLESEPCENDQCIASETKTPKREPFWGPWSEWTPCSEVCGVGVKRRRRVCLEKPSRKNDEILGTICKGSHDQVETCSNKKCDLDGGWTGWGAWTACSKSCGPGLKTRSRTCTRPIPIGSGKNCPGPHTEHATCNLSPCDSYSHQVAVFYGIGNIQYIRKNFKTTLFHVYVRFKPLTMQGEIISRGNHSSLMISIRKWRVHVSMKNTLKGILTSVVYSSEPLDPAVWHTLMVTITPDQVTLRVDDSKTPIVAPLYSYEIFKGDNDIRVGKSFTGQIQEVFVNFMQLDLKLEKKRSSLKKLKPSTAANVEYSQAELEEGFLYLSDDYYIRVPCFVDQNQWFLELVIKPVNTNGIVLFSWNNESDSWLMVELIKMRLKIIIAAGDVRSEAATTDENLADNWLHITIAKDKNKNIIHVTVNNGESLHVPINDIVTKKRNPKSQFHELAKDIFLNFMKRKPSKCDLKNKRDKRETDKTILICADEFFIGGIPVDIMNELNITNTFPFTGTVASLSINDVLQDLYTFDVERYKDDTVQVSSRTASMSSFYLEAGLGMTHKINLTCLHSRRSRSKKEANWLYLDTIIPKETEKEHFKFHDDGKTLRLMSSISDNLKGFYTCRAITKGRMMNLVTYGVFHVKNSSWNLAKSIDIITGTIALILTTITILWILKEGLLDLKNGYGFFRDINFTAAQEMDALIKYIESPENKQFFESQEKIEMAKEKARKKAETKENINNVFSRKFDDLFYKDDSSVQEQLHNMRSRFRYRRNPTITAYPITKVHANRLRRSTRSRKSLSVIPSNSRISKISTNSAAKRIKLRHDAGFRGEGDAGRGMSMSPGQKVLQKFQELKCDD